MNNLRKTSIKAIKWSAIATVGRFGLQLIAQIVLARILGPENYGLFGIGMIVYTFGNFFSNFGFGRNLLQKIEITDVDIRFAFTWQMITGSIATLTIYFSAPSLANYFNDPRVLPIIEYLSFACLLNAAAAPANNLLQRDLNFKTVGIIQISSYALGYLVLGIPLAIAGFEVYALVTAWLTQIITTTIATYYMKPHSLRPLFWYPNAKNAINYGSTVFLTNIINWLLNNLDRVVIGRFLNAHSVGLYTASYNVATMPNTFLLGSLQTAFLATGAKIQTDTKRLGETYLQVLGTISVIILPTFVFLAVLSEQIIALLYGSNWKESANTMAILFLGMPAFIIWGLSTPILWNTSREKLEYKLQLPILIMSAIALFACAHKGIDTVAAITTGTLYIRGIFISIAALNALSINKIELMRNFVRGIPLSLVSASVALAGIYITRNSNHALISIAASSLMFVLTFISIWIISPQVFGKEAITMINRFIPIKK
jgi:O-antigen/teichoic acid export membrane protein